MLAVGYEDGLVQLFDVNGSQYLWNTQLKDGVCSIDFLNDKLLVSTLNGAYKINIESGKIEQVQVINSTDIDNYLIDISCLRPQRIQHYGVLDIYPTLNTLR